MFQGIYDAALTSI